MRQIALLLAACCLACTAAGAEADGTSLIANGDFERGLDGWYNWSKKGSDASVSPGVGVEGSAGVVLSAGPDRNSPASLATWRIALDGGKTMLLSFAGRALESPVELALRFTPKTSEREFLKHDVSWRRWRVEPGNWQRFEHAFMVPNAVGRGGQCYFTFSCGKGSLTLDSVRLVPYAAGMVLRYDGQEIPPGRSAPRPFPALPARGEILFYQRPDPGDFGALRGDEPPVEGELIERVSTFCAGSAEARFWFGVVGQRDLVSPVVSLGPLQSEQGREFPAEDVRLDRILVWPRRVARTTLSYRMVPELLEPLSGVEGRYAVPATEYDTAAWDWREGQGCVFARGVPQQFLVTCRRGHDAAPGLYRGALMVEAQGVLPSSLPVLLRVLPFELERPDPKQRHWSLDGDTSRYGAGEGWSVEAIRRELAVLHAAGYDGLKCKGLWTQVKKDGVWTSIDIAGFGRVLRALRDVGMAGPVYVSNQRLPMNLGRWLGQSFDPRDASGWTPEFQSTLRTAVGMLDAIMRAAELPWYLYPADEIYGTDRRVPAANILKTLKQIVPQIPISVTTDVEFTNREVPGTVTRRMYNPRFCALNQAVNDVARAEAERLGAPYDIYGSGCYGSQMGNVSANRYWAGALFWKCGAAGHHTWTLQRGSGSPWNAFDGHDFVVLYPAKFDAAPFTRTLQWQGLKDGILDGWYFWTLEQTLQRALLSPHDEVKTLAGLLASEYAEKLASVPWAEDYWPAPLDSHRFENLRWWVARSTQSLLDAMAGRAAADKPAATAVPADAVRLAFYDEAADPGDASVSDSDGPYFRIPALGTVPQVDGGLDDGLESALSAVPCAGAAGETEPGTSVRFGHTEEHLWMLAVCEEPSMDTLKLHLPTGKGKVWRDDSIELFLDTNFDRRSHFQFIVNAAGNALLYHVRGGPEAGSPPEEVPLDGWRFAVAKTASSWTVELLVPVARLRGRLGVWGVGFVRNRWASGREQHLFYPSGVWLFKRPDLFIPTCFDGGAVQLDKLLYSEGLLGVNRVEFQFRSWPPSVPLPRVHTDPEVTTRLTADEGVPGRFVVEYELPRPGAYEIGLTVVGASADAAVRHYAVHPLVSRVLRPPDKHLRLYSTAELQVRLPFRLRIRRAALPKVTIGVRLACDASSQGRGLLLREQPSSAAFDVLLRPARISPGRYELGLDVLYGDSQEEPVLSSTIPLDILPGYD